MLLLVRCEFRSPRRMPTERARCWKTSYRVEFLMDVISFAKLFDHSIVRPNATRAEVIQFGETAARLGTATLTVQPHYVPLAAELLRGTDVLVGTVVGFPHGNETPAMKRYQAEQVLALGAQEIDMVMNIPALKNSEQQVFMRDIEGV